MSKFGNLFRNGQPLRFFRSSQTVSERMNGWLALSPMFVFIGIYLLSSIIAHDFYTIPITAAFAIASVYAIAITRTTQTPKKSVDIFSDGAGNRNVLLMIWIFVLAGAFAQTAKDMGAIEATVNLTLQMLPSHFLLAGLFLAACFISMAIGTSVGTIVAMIPITTAIAQQVDMNVGLLTAVILGGAFFGDNLSFISDTTIAATQSQGCSMSDKFKTNFSLAAPAALLAIAVYVYLGWDISASATAQDIAWIKILPYILAIILAISGINVVTVLAIGVLLNGIIGISTGGYDWTGWLISIGDGIKGMGELIIITMLAGGMLELIRYNGGLDFIIRNLTKKVKTKRGASFTIALLVTLINICTANNTIAIITTGGIAKDITARYQLNPRKTASILDIFSCITQCLLPYGAQMLMAATLSGVSAIMIIPHIYYAYMLLVFTLLSILFGRKL